MGPVEDIGRIIASPRNLIASRWNWMAGIDRMLVPSPRKMPPRGGSRSASHAF